jgi:hypothetical protein
MYKRLLAVYAIGFGLGLLLTGMFFEYVLSPLGNPIAVENMRVDWRSMVTTWQYLGAAWFAGGALLFMAIRRLEGRGSGGDAGSGGGNAEKKASGKANNPGQGVRDVGSFRAVEKSLERYRKQLEELERGLMKAGLDLGRLKACIGNRDFAKTREKRERAD